MEQHNDLHERPKRMSASIGTDSEGKPESSLLLLRKQRPDGWYDISGVTTKQLPCVALNGSKNHQVLYIMRDLELALLFPAEEGQPSPVHGQRSFCSFVFMVFISAE